MGYGKGEIPRAVIQRPDDLKILEIAGYQEVGGSHEMNRRVHLALTEQWQDIGIVLHFHHADVRIMLPDIGY
ncbi:hypothetical protein D3C76_1344820 [compost metagenome]